MARPLRIEFPGALYHVTARGNERRPIFRDDHDRERFLGRLAEAASRHRLVVHAFVLMRNHYHLLAQTPDGHLARAMRDLNGAYTQDFNRRHRRVGHLLQGRYKALLVQRAAYLLELSRYIHLNPVRVGEVVQAWEFPWSSAAAYVGAVAAPTWLRTTDVLRHFGRRMPTARRRYAWFVSDGATRPPAAPWHQVEGQILLGERRWAERMKRYLAPRSFAREVAAAKALRPRPGLSTVITQVARTTGVSCEHLLRRHGARTHWARPTAMALAVELCGLTHEAIGHTFGVGPSAVSKAVRRAADLRAGSAHVARTARALKGRFRT